MQFTVDLLPSDIIGINSFDPQTKEYKVVNGPIFTNLLLADEINRASPKVQSALLEAMAEKQVTIGNSTQTLPKPFFVFATQNPLESLGTYPLPQAQLDRFLFKLIISYPSVDEEEQILSMRVNQDNFAKVKQILTPKEIITMQREINDIYVDESVKKYIVNLIDMTRFPKKYKLKSAEYIELGCGPRATLGLIVASRAEAYMNGRLYVTPQDVKEVARDVLAHRIEVNYLGQAKNITADVVIKEMLLTLPIDLNNS